VTTPRPPSLEVVAISPQNPTDGKPWSVHFRLINNGLIKVPLNGIVRAIAYNDREPSHSSLISSSAVAVRNVPVGQSLEGDLNFENTGGIVNGTVELTYYSVSGSTQLPFRTLLKAGKASPVSVTAAAFVVFIDRDNDAIDDAVEQQLLSRFRPYLFFSNDGGDEKYAPADIALYLSRSEVLTSGDEGSDPLITQETLAANPETIINLYCQFGSANFTINAQPTNYHVNPVQSVPGVNWVDPGRHGNDWGDVQARPNVGLYGHVVPVKLSDPYGFSFDATASQPSVAMQAHYKIEYWLFFGYNEAEKAYIGNHEGDWASVQLVYDPNPGADIVRTAFHFAHGLMFRFDITSQANARTVTFAVEEGEIKEYRGANYFKYRSDVDLVDLDLGTIPQRLVTNDDQLAHAQQNIMRFFRRHGETEFSHPVVYIENGTHEFFPSEGWNFYGAPNHNGKSYHFLTAAPPNLGEIDFPLDEAAAARIILWFNGYWGAFSRYNDPPHGPPLHRNWTPLAGSPSDESRRKLNNLGF
jgi:hypothetical protein